MDSVLFYVCEVSHKASLMNAKLRLSFHREKHSLLFLCFLTSVA